MKGIVRLADRTFMRNESILIFADIADLKKEIIELPNSFTIEKITKKEDLAPKDMERFLSYSHPDFIKHYINEHFRKGAILWVLKSDGDIVSFEWSLRGENAIGHYFFPMTPNDVVIFDAHTWEEYRGHTYYAILVKHILMNLSKEGVTRVYTEVKARNVSGMAIINKTCLRPFGVARKFQIKNKLITTYLTPKG